MRWTASKLSRNCAHHHLLSDLHPRPTRDKAAAKGKAFHTALQDWHATGIVPVMADDDITGWLATMVDHGWAWPDGCLLEVPWGLDTWGKFSAVEEKPPGSHIYVPLNGIDDLTTAGRADACWLDGGDVLVSCDFKTGRTLVPPARINLQVNAAGIALADRFKARAYRPVIYYAREGRWDVGDEVEIEAGGPIDVVHDWIDDAAALDDQPHPGPHCADCWERRNCSAAS